MNNIKKYLNHLKDDPEGYWFKRKLYGWGWTPARRQGWLVIIIYIVFVLMLAARVEKYTQSGVDVLVGIGLPLLFATAILLVICYVKGEKPRWQWGEKGKE